MRLYHYTNIETLALILKNKTIRFNRLDNVDDLEEGRAESLGVKFCRYVFVSCWTKSEEESIPLWKMYGGDKGGIRISLEHEMFQEYPMIKSQESVGKGLWGCSYPYSMIPTEDMFKPTFFFIPIHQYDNDMFFREVQYVDDVFRYTKDKIGISRLQDGRDEMHMDMKPFGYYKHKRWAFQKETRFVLYALPFNPFLESSNPNVGGLVQEALKQNKNLPFLYYDLHLRNEVFDKLIITLSPSATESQRILVGALRDKYAPSAQIEESSLGKVVRLK